MRPGTGRVSALTANPAPRPRAAPRVRCSGLRCGRFPPGPPRPRWGSPWVSRCGVHTRLQRGFSEGRRHAVTASVRGTFELPAPSPWEPLPLKRELWAWGLEPCKLHTCLLVQKHVARGCDLIGSGPGAGCKSPVFCAVPLLDF